VLSVHLEADATANTLRAVLNEADHIKYMHATTVQSSLEVLNAAKLQQMNTAIAVLTLDECDVLMKYVYKGLAARVANAVLYCWRAEVVEKAGSGCIVRCIVDHKTVCGSAVAVAAAAAQR
jgi:ARP2/3 complex 16 kDa subunit (p16-Arc)